MRNVLSTRESLYHSPKDGARAMRRYDRWCKRNEGKRAPRWMLENARIAVKQFGVT